MERTFPNSLSGSRASHCSKLALFLTTQREAHCHQQRKCWFFSIKEPPFRYEQHLRRTRFPQPLSLVGLS